MKGNVMLKLLVNLAVILSLSMLARSALANEVGSCRKPITTAIALDIELLGDTTVKSMQQQDELLLAQFSDEFRLRLKQQHVFNIVDDKQSLSIINQAADKQFLHRCNGCELSLAKQLGAKQVIVPWVFRMSKLVQTMFVELRDVDTGILLMRKKLNFRGNTENAWDHVTNRMVEEIQFYLSRCR